MDWVNDIVITHLTRIEQLGAGNIYCQLLDAAYPDEVQLHKVKWGAYLEVDFLHNFKILQTAFQKIGIKKQFNVRIFLLSLKNWLKLSIKITGNSSNGSKDSFNKELYKMECIMLWRKETIRRLICCLAIKIILI